MNNYLNQTCLNCTYREKPRPPISNHLLKIHQAIKKLNPKLQKEMNQLIDQKWK